MQTPRELDSKTQQTIFEKVKQLHADGLGYKRIIRTVKIEDQIQLSKGTLSYWFSNDVKIVGGQNHFHAVPSPELAYLIGVVFGDGCLSFYKPKQEYAFVLDAKDKDFVENFADCTAKLLGKERPFYVSRGADGHYSTKAHSKRMYYFLKSFKEDFEKAKPFIEAFPADFIRGLADSEGCPSICATKKLSMDVIVAYSANEKLLQYTAELLSSRLGIHTFLRKNKTAGMQDSTIEGRLITRTKDLFELKVASKDTKNFCSLIGFTIKRKKQKINDFFFLSENYRHNASTKWKELYEKIGKQRVKKQITR